MATPTHIADAVSVDFVLPPAERDAVLEVALLAIGADREIDGKEAEAFRLIAAKLGADATELLARFVNASSREDADARLHAAGAPLSTSTARALAFAASYALSLADEKTSDEEFEFELQLIDALELSQAEADRITAEIDEAVRRP